MKNSVSWIVHVRPQPDELLSSWLVRNALVQLTKVHTFCSSNWPSIEFWNRDIDRFSHPLVIQLLAHRTSTPLKAANETSLQSYIGKLYKKDAKTFNSFLLPCGIWHRKRKLPGLMFCPSCLEKDGEHPYYRKIWRVSLSFCCTKCGILLLDRCEFCKAPVAFFRNDFISKSDIPRRKIDQCYNCGKSLIHCTRLSASANQLRLQAILEEYIETGFQKYHMRNFFEVVQQIQWCLYSKSKRLTGFKKIVKKKNPFRNNYNFSLRNKKLNLFAFRGIEQRRLLFQISCWVLDSFPFRLRNLMQESNTTFKAIVGENKFLPNWFTDRLLTPGLASQKNLTKFF
ncbi:MAG: TniQ family protein [Bacteroidetes bacterium]|nr:TniQ family protein [Bacteroidota bacterium]